jgi:hypothetical protein
VLGLVDFDFQYFFSTVADHYIYVAMAGPALLVAVFATHTRTRGRVFMTIVLILLAVRGAIVTGAWADTQSLCNNALSIDPNNTAANLLLANTDSLRAEANSANGNAPLARQYFDSAMNRYQLLLSLRPKDGVVLHDQGNLDLQFGRIAPAARLARTGRATTPRRPANPR